MIINQSCLSIAMYQLCQKYFKINKCVIYVFFVIIVENIQWVSVEEIEERWQGAEISTLPDGPRLVGSGHSAGGVIGCTVGPSADAGLAQVR